MKFAHKTLLIASFSALAITAACQATPKLEEAQYWQRSNATSALYLRGPKAQQSLHVDIAACVNELSELERVGALREAVPADTRNRRVPDPSTATGRLARWESPKRDGYLRNEHLPYHDFETCMGAKGWERVEALPYSQADIARQDYLRNVYGNEFQTRHNVSQTPAPANAYQNSPGGEVIND